MAKANAKLRRACVRISVSVATALLVAGSAVAPASSADPYTIYAVESLTGPAAFLGKSEAKSLEAIELLTNKSGGIKGRPIHFDISDDQTNAAVSVQLATSIIAKGVPVVLGPTLGSTCTAQSTLYKNGPVAYCFSPIIHPVAPSFVFSAGTSASDSTIAALRWAKARKLTKIAFLNSTDTTGQVFEAAGKAGLQLHDLSGVQLVADEHFNISDVGVTAQLTRVKAAGAQVLFVNVTGTPLGTVLRNAFDLDLSLPVMTVSGNINYTQIEQYASFLPKELYFSGYRFLAHDTQPAGPVRDAQQRFIKALKAVGVDRPDLTYTYSWDAALIIVDALRHLGTNATAEQVRSYIVNLHGYAGITGLMDCRDGQQRGLQAYATAIVSWDKATHDFIRADR
ncbi:MAG: ABC transporter substrate-binding protein [Candidatus Velthaea sp.]